jgi:hypothetical protein
MMVQAIKDRWAASEQLADKVKSRILHPAQMVSPDSFAV